MAEQNLPPEPKIVTSPGIEDKLVVDANAIGETMADLGITPEAISATSIFIDDSNRIATNGIAYPTLLGRIRHVTNPQLRNADGPIVRISSVARGTERPEDAINATLIHELEHVAQMERNDPKLILGHIAIWGLAVAGGFTANLLSRGHGKAVETATTLMGAALGQQIGYKIAPHEVQARECAHTASTSAIKRK